MQSPEKGALLSLGWMNGYTRHPREWQQRGVHHNEQVSGSLKNERSGQEEAMTCNQPVDRGGFSSTQLQGH